MKKFIIPFFMVLFCLLFIDVGVSGAEKTKNVVLLVGETYTLPQYKQDGTVNGSSVVIEDGVLTAVSTGKSSVTYSDISGKPCKISVNVKKSGILVTMLDIGQGDSFLIQVNGMKIMLDTGEKKYYEYLKQQLDYLDVKKIDVLIISHMDTDHMGAAQMVVQDYKVNKVMMPVTPGKSTEYNKLMNCIDRELIETVYVKSGDVYSMGKGCSINILGADVKDDTNDSSIVMRLKYYKNTFLFTGDASASVLNQIMEEGMNIEAGVLKIPHHGSDSSSPILFLKNVGAKYALISVGRNNEYGHPTDNILRRLKTLKCKVFRTDEQGTVTIQGDGKKLKYEHEQVIDWDAEQRLKVEDGNIIGNINSKVYHSHDCMSLPAEKNRIYFESAEDAELAGYRKCGMCIK